MTKSGRPPQPLMACLPLVLAGCVAPLPPSAHSPKGSDAAVDAALFDRVVVDSGHDTDAPASALGWAICGAAHGVSGDRLDVEIELASIVAVRAAGESPLCAEEDAIAAPDRWLLPAFIDSHVHIDYYPVAAELAWTGVAAAVDLAAPLSALGSDMSPLHVLWSGPMITAVGGYPTQSWGADGFGIEVADAEAARNAVDQLQAAGAALIKVPFTSGPSLDDAQAGAVITRAHELGLRVAAHALGDAQALRAAQLGADLLAHTPTEPLGAATLEAWRGRAVVGTLVAFGAGSAAIQNLGDLHAHDVQILYGTDLGNSRQVGIQAAEVEAMLQAGLTTAEIINAATASAADYWGLADMGLIAPGAAASLMLLDANPLLDPSTMSRPVTVILDGLLQQ